MTSLGVMTIWPRLGKTDQVAFREAGLAPHHSGNSHLALILNLTGRVHKAFVMNAS